MCFLSAHKFDQQGKGAIIAKEYSREKRFVYGWAQKAKLMLSLSRWTFRND